MAGSITHRPSRRSPWLARYRGPDGRERSRAFGRKVDADRWLRAEFARVDRGEWIDPSAGMVRLASWAPVWLAGKVRLAEKTRVGYQGILDSRVLPAFGSVPVARVSRSAVQEWVGGMVDEGLSPSRVRNCFNVLASCLDRAVAEGLIGRNPARGVELPARAESEPRFLTAAQVERLAAAVPTLADEALILVLAYGGLRWGEAVALRRGRTDILARRLRIGEAATEISGRLSFGEPKTHRRRIVQVPGFVAELLGRHLEDRPVDPEALVWTAPKGGPLRYNPYRHRVWDRAVAAAGPDFEGVTPHALRHSCASLMRAQGADASEVGAQLGHRSAVVTLSVYTHLFEDALDPVMDRLDDEYRSLPRTTGGPNVVPLERASVESGL